MPRLVENIENRWAWTSITLIVAFVFELGTLGLLVFEGRYFASFGYSLNYPLLVGVYAVILGGLGWLWFNRRRGKSGDELKPVYLLYWLLAAYLLVGLVSIVWFPLNPKRSDMLPLIIEAGHTFLNGQSPYRVYPLVSGAIELTYLPGTWLTYLPAVALELDVRLMSLLYVVGTALILYWGCLASERSKILILISVFVLNPYLQYRHEIYLAPYWCVMAASLVAFRKNRPLWGVFFFGLSITMSQFSWIMLPFLGLYLYRNFGIRLLALAGGIIGLVVALLVGPFIAWTPQTFISGVLTHWNEATGVNARTANFSYWAAKLVGIKNLQLVQAALLILLFGLALFRVRTLAEALGWMAVALITFIVFNLLIWPYFYLSLFIILLAHLLTSPALTTTSKQPQLTDIGEHN